MNADLTVREGREETRRTRKRQKEEKESFSVFFPVLRETFASSASGIRISDGLRQEQ
ncbi:hypothetical protein [Variovorax rhizosphaerae]|uniref:Uncharacterized protein n=1 Tax=Variovorax rhizosphaerae TaxID=1836200 RepID=A0ABU8WJV2_9BURK